MDPRGVHRVGAGTMDMLMASFTACPSTNRGAKHTLKARGKVTKEMDRTADWLSYVRDITRFFFFKSVCVENVCACANGGSRVREWLKYSVFFFTA